MTSPISANLNQFASSIKYALKESNPVSIRANGTRNRPGVSSSLERIIGIKSEFSPGAKGKRVSEQDLYAAVVHERLQAINPEAAKLFESELSIRYAAISGRNPENAMFRATERILRSLVKSNDISQADFRRIRMEALGKAQLDGDRTTLTGASQAGDSIVTALMRSVFNNGATEGEYQAFRQGLKQAKRSRIQPRAAASASPTQSTSSHASSSASHIGGPAGFLWKPESDSNGNLVILLPISWTSNARSVAVLSPDGKTVLANGQYAGVGNGGRQHYRFAAPGGSFPPGAIVQVTFQDGSTQTIKIQDTSSRLEAKG